MTTTSMPPHLADPRLPAVEEMLGDGALHILEAALDDPGRRVREARRTHVTWSPGRHAEVRYAALVESDGESRLMDLVVATGDRIQGVPARRLRPLDAAVEDDRADVAAWEMKDDPLLPGLRTALEPDAVRALLQQTGVPPAPVRLRLRAYRPLRRALVEAQTGAYRLFLKVVPPSEAGALQDRHRTIAQHVVAPASHGWSPDHGILVLEAVPGRNLREAIVAGAEAPSPETLADVLAGLPALPDARPARSGLRTALGHVALLDALAPEDARLIEDVSRGLQAVPRGEHIVPVHGDFHAGQVLVEEGRVAGVLDLDTVGMGESVGDWATLIAQFVTSTALAAPEQRPALTAYADRLLRHAEGEHGRELLAAHIAGNILGLATGPFRVQMDGWHAETRRRLRLAATWAHRAGIEARLEPGDGGR